MAAILNFFNVYTENVIYTNFRFYKYACGFQKNQWSHLARGIARQIGSQKERG